VTILAAPLRVWLLLWLVCASWTAWAEADIPPLTARVTDLTGTLDAGQRQTLEQGLKDFEARKGSQLAVLIVPSTEPESIEQYSLRVVERWKLGRKNIDDGALLIVAKDDRTLRIEVGYGLEGALNDAVSKRIISEVIVPSFKQGDFYGGIHDGLDRMMRVVDGEPLPPPKSRASGSTGQPNPVWFVIAMVVGGFFRVIFGNLFGALVAGGLVGGLAWLMTGLLPVALIAGVAAGVFALFGDFSSGSRYGHRGGMGGGGFGGGGFGGGGGGFGGGGASGRW
jgi:uncharacterized protein